jgi:hypothetical protein
MRHCLRVHGRRRRSPHAQPEFGLEQELAALAATWPGARLVEIWNRLPGKKPVAKFTNRNAAVQRIWKAVQMLESAAPDSLRSGVPKTGTRPRTAKATGTGAREQTKTERVIALLKEPAGATLKQLMALTLWQSHSVRGFLSAHLSKRMGLRVRSFKRDGERVYSIKT